MRSAFQTLIYGAIFISLCAVALCMETSLLLGFPLNNFSFYLVVFSATLGQYNIHYYIKRSAGPSSDRFAWSRQHRHVHLALNIVGAAGLLGGLFHLQPRHFMVLGIIAVLTVLYSFPFLPFERKKRLKDFGLLKILVLTYVWTLITVWFPVVSLSRITADFRLVFIHRFIFMFALCLAFDIRDREADAADGIGTIPVRLGRRRSFMISYATLAVFAVLTLLLFRSTGNLPQLHALLLSTAATAFVVGFAKRRDTDMYYLACIDGMMLLQAILVGLSAVNLY